MFCVNSGADKLFKTIKMNNLGLIVENLLHLIITSLCANVQLDLKHPESGLGGPKSRLGHPKSGQTQDKCWTKFELV